MCVCVQAQGGLYVWKHAWFRKMEDKAGEIHQLSRHLLDGVKEHVWVCVVRFLCPPVPFLQRWYYSLLQDCVCELGKKLDSLGELH